VKYRFLRKVLMVAFLAELPMGCMSQLLSKKEQELPAPTVEEIKQKADSTLSSANFLENEEYLYKILVAEIAEQREYYALSSQYFLDVAKWTRNPLFIERAVYSALEAKNYDIALESVNLWLAVEPENFDANQLIIIVFLHQDNIAKAVEHLDIQLSYLKENAGSYLSAFISNVKNRSQALALMQGLNTKHPDNTEILIAYARLLIDDDQIDLALPILEKLLNTDSENMQAMVLNALAFEKKGDVEETLTWMEKILKKQPDKDEWHLIYARLLVDAGRYEDAIVEFENLLTNDPENGDFLYALGMLSLETQKLSESKEYFNILAQIEDHSDTAYFYLAQIAESENKTDLAISYYKKITGDSDNYVGAQARVAMIFVKQKQLDKAIEHLHSVNTENEQDQLKLIQFEAELLTDQKQYERAMLVYNTALNTRQDNVDLLYMRGLLAERMDKLDQTERDFRRVLELDPEYVQAINALGYTLADRTNRYQEAYDLIKRALALSPNDYYILDSMGWVLYRLGNHTESLKYLRKAESMKHDPDVAAHLGEVLWQSGDKQAAKTVWQKALESFPDHELLQKVVNRLMGAKE
jgi:tetratricopeptide (TPR) repeat protein